MTVIDDLPWARIGTALGLIPQDGQDTRDHRPADAGREVPRGVGAPGRFGARQSSTTAGLRLHAGGETSAVAGRHEPATGRTRENRSSAATSFCSSVVRSPRGPQPMTALLVLRNKAIKPRRSTPPPSPGAATQNRSTPTTKPSELQ
jgi:hypothetical protein